MVGGLVGALLCPACLGMGMRLGGLSFGALGILPILLILPGALTGLLVYMALGAVIELFGVPATGQLFGGLVILCNAAWFAWTADALKRGPTRKRVAVAAIWVAWGVLSFYWLKSFGND